MGRIYTPDGILTYFELFSYIDCGHIYWPFGTLLSPTGPLWTISDKNDFFVLNGQSRVWRKCSMNKKIVFVLNFLKESRWAQKGHKWSKTLGLTILVPFKPFWTILECVQNTKKGPKLNKFIVDFLGHPVFFLFQLYDPLSPSYYQLLCQSLTSEWQLL